MANIKYECSFYLWAFLLAPSRDEKIMSELIKLGYEVRAISSDPKFTTVTEKGAPAGILGIHVKKL